MSKYTKILHNYLVTLSTVITELHCMSSKLFNTVYLELPEDVLGHVVLCEGIHHKVLVTRRPL